MKLQFHFSWKGQHYWNDGRGTKCFLHLKCSSKAGKVTSAGGSFAHQCQICRAVFGEVDVMLARQISWQTCGVCVCVTLCSKESLFSQMFVVTICRGQWPIHGSIANEATHELGGYHD